MKLLFITDYLSGEWVRAICRSLLHSLWLGLAAAAIAGMILLLTRKTRAALRYNLLSLVFVSFLLSVFVAFLVQPGILGPLTSHNQGESVNTQTEAAIQVAGDHALIPAFNKEAYYQKIFSYADEHALLVTVCWIFLVLLQLVRMSTGLHYVYRIRRRRITPVPEAWQHRLGQLAERLGIRQAVLLMESGLIRVPVVIGTLKPMILVPLGMFAQLPPDQVETILLHELAHVRRRDFAINLLQRIVESFLFFNPFIRWLSARIREEREACCDDIVTGEVTDKRSYLEALICFREPQDISFTPAITLGKQKYLLNRVRRMLTQENNKLNAMEKLVLILVLVVAAAFTFIPAQSVQKKGTTNKEIAAKSPDFRTTDFRTSIDTLPKKAKPSIDNISTHMNSQDGKKTVDIIATAKDGKTYKYTMTDGKLTALSLDDKEIPADQWDAYKNIIEEVEASRQESLRKLKADQQQQMEKMKVLEEHLKEQKLKLEKEQVFQLEHDQKLALEHEQMLNYKMKQELYQQKKAELDLQNEKNLRLYKSTDPLIKQEKMLLELQQQHALDEKILVEKLNQDNMAQELAKEKVYLELLDQHNNQEQAFKKQLLMQKELLAAQDMKFHNSNDDIARIVAALAEAGVIKDKDKFSFSLDYNKLVVDGRRQEAALHEKLRKQFIHGKKDYYKYKAAGASRSTDVYVE